MDVSKEIQIITKNADNAESVFDEIRNQQDELDKKRHLLRVVQLVCHIEKFLEAGNFREHDIDSIKISLDEDETGRYKGFLDVLDSKGERLIYDPVMSELKKNIIYLKEIFSNLDGAREKDVDEKFPLRANYILKLESGIKNQIIDLFLSKELKTILNYNKMEIGLSNDTNSAIKRMKV